jgi:maltooligosyltrehalose trehalohydrolase
MDPETQKGFAAPHDRRTFERCKLDFTERESHAGAYRLTRDLLQLRKRDPVFGKPRPRGVDGAVIGPDAFVLRYFDPDGWDRLLLVNLGRDLYMPVMPEPLLAPPHGGRWKLLLSTEDAKYCGTGTPALEPEGGGCWKIAAECALVFTSEAS